ncbi:MAG TPA: potassium transporter KefA [Ruminococcaceae bacterium]|nr:potassium transporter KefA [Oscillospiraceae bacterium]
MNRKAVFRMLGRLAQTEGLLLLLPALVGFLYRESCAWWFLAVAAGTFLLGTAAVRLLKTASHVIYAKEGFAIVGLAWIFTSLIGALPAFLSGDIPDYIDAFFETVSGFTTTGASILRDVESLSHGVQFWRCFTHWIGGMGILVFVVALMPNVSARSIHILRAERPGPTMGKLVPRLKDTAKILYLIYVAMTAIEVILLLCGKMPLFDSLVHAFGTAGTGGFAIKANGLAGYSPYLQWVIAVFMMLFGINFNLYYLLLIRRAKSALRSEELWTYLGVILVATCAIFANIRPLYANASDAVRDAFFQVSSVTTTTGFSTADFNLWPQFSRAVIFALLFLGGCAGSTAGGLKVSRAVILLKQIRRELKHLLHPRSVSAVRFEGKALEKETLHGVTTYFAAYMFSILAVFLILSFEPFELETNLTAAISCFNNVGPGLGAVGPMGSYADYSGFAKLVLSFAMLLGRLEIFPLLLACAPSTWTKK